MLQVDQLIERVKAYQPSVDPDLIQRAYDYSFRMHAGQMRKSGQPYIVHPVSVAGILADLRLDAASVCAGLLHDVVEDTLATTDEIQKEFGVEVAELVDGVTKLSKINFTSKEDRQAENFRKMVVAMARDIRVLLIKLCDRLDNMRTLEHMNARGAGAHRARDARDLRAAREPPRHPGLQERARRPELQVPRARGATADLVAQMTKTKRERDKYITEVCKTLSSRLAEQGFAAEVTGRAKHLYSVYRKMKAQQSGIEGVHDLIAFRVVVESVSDCYAALGVIHSQWTPVPGRFKDYVALPKPNMYQSLHTTVIGPGRERIEIQIRTHEMHRVAERGIAAHWKYKDRGGGIADQDAQRFSWLRQLLEWQKELKDPAEFLEGVKVDLFQDEVYVFTPKGDVRVFPRGATPIDFAYQIHTQLGDHVTGARINGKIEPLRYKLRNGDVVEILTHAPPAPGQGLARLRRAPRGPARRSAITCGKSSATRASASAKSCSRRSSTPRAISATQAVQERRRDAPRLRDAQGAEPRGALHRHRLRQDRSRGDRQARLAAGRRRPREQAARSRCARVASRVSSAR